MLIRQQEIKAESIKFSAQVNGEEIGRAYLYLIKNDLHDKHYGLLEDVYVADSHRQQGIGTELLRQALEKARELGCYKLIACSRFGREDIHHWYQKSGFRAYGKEFRMDF